MISFTDFFRLVHGEATPYPWQQRFAERCVESAPPPMVCAPTGTGKTVVIDALIWALAAQADRPACDRTIGVRTVWAIDRRILVDEVHNHASELAGILLGALEDRAHPLREMADRLAALSGDRPLVATRWRGGVRDTEDLLGPLQPQIITSTIAQVGSRLLFRGYGVGRGSLALQAGLVACDTTICLDEAHLAEPFSETVEAVRRRREDAESSVRLPQLNVVTLTATPTDPPDGAIRLSAKDERVLGKRIRGPKWASLDDSAATDRKRAVLLADLTAAYVEDGSKTVACVTNTVKQAREVFGLLQKKLPKEEAALDLLIGPQRPADREEILAGPVSALFDGKGPPECPVVCVATQTFEVGLDADVAAMVTESASASALVQRFGRLNRRGVGVGRATIVRDAGSWLYGGDEALAWEWLLSRRQENGEVDISVASIDRDQSRPRPLHVPAAATLTTDVVDLLVQTGPLPGRYQDPDVEPFLRGAESESSLDVAVCWRCDLRPEGEGQDADEYREILLELFPPQPQEKLTLSIRSARALLAALYPIAAPRRSAALAAALTDTDIEGSAPAADAPATGENEVGRPFVVVRRGKVLPGSLAGENENTVRPTELEPGDVVVLPTSAGGVDKNGLTTDGHVKDVATDLHPTQEVGSARLSPEVLRQAWSKRPLQKQWDWITRRCQKIEGASANNRSAAIVKLIEEIEAKNPSYEGFARLAAATSSGTRLAIRLIEATSAEEIAEAEFELDSTGEVSEAPEAEADSNDNGRPAAPMGPTWVITTATEDHKDQADRTSADPPPSLASHAEAVHARTREFATAIGLPPEVIEALELAARAHDHGKADPRIQAFYRRGVAPVGEPPLAKSVFGTRDPRTARIATKLAGLPSGLRHEIASAAILADALERDPGLSANNLDRDLALHLVATHHGHARPIPAVPTAGAPPRTFYCDAAGVTGSARGDGAEDWMSGEALRRFWEVIRRYGHWGTAYLEAVLMLADRTVSSEGR